jgi:hypothetical protein
LALADLNGDGNLDLVTANSGARSASVLLGRNDGTFARKVDVAIHGAPGSIVVGDLDGDGKLDLLTTNDDESVSVFPGHGDGTFATEERYPLENGSRGLVLGDLDRDGRSDLVMTAFGSNAIVVVNACW